MLAFWIGSLNFKWELGRQSYWFESAEKMLCIVALRNLLAHIWFDGWLNLIELEV